MPRQAPSASRWPTSSANTGASTASTATSKSVHRDRAATSRRRWMHSRRRSSGCSANGSARRGTGRLASGPAQPWAIPSGIDAPTSRLIFRGRTAQGVDVDVRERADGGVEIDLDGKPSERLVDRLHLTVDAGGWAQIADVHAQETFNVPAPAAQALRRWMRAEARRPGTTCTACWQKASWTSTSRSLRAGDVPSSTRPADGRAKRSAGERRPA